MRHIYSEQEAAWIAEHAETMTSEELKDAFNQEFDACVTIASIQQKYQRMGIRKGAENRKYTQEEENFLRVNRDKMPMRELHKLFCEKFSEINYYALKCKAQRMGIRVDDAQKFNKIGERSKVPVGSEHKYAGYTMIKVSDKATGTKKDRSYKENWKPKHIWVWEQHHGRLPPKHQVIFLDGNRENFNIENLMAIPLQYVYMMNRNGWIKGNPEITKTAVKLCELLYRTEGQK